MPARESALWKMMRDSHLPGHWVRVENRVERGTPDVNFSMPEGEGWIELKSIDHLPMDYFAPFRIRHFTMQQRSWLRRRAEAGGFAAVLLRAERGPREYLLLPGAWAAERIGEAAAEEARGVALGVWGPAWDREALLRGIRKCLRDMHL